MQRGHGFRAYSAAKAIAHDQVGPVAQLLEEAGKMVELVRVIGVAHEYVLSARGEDAGVQGRSVAANRHGDQACAVIACNLLGAIGRPVVGDDDLARNRVGAQRGVGFVDTGGEGFGLVQAGHHYRELHRGQGGVGQGRLVVFVQHGSHGIGSRRDAGGW